jgi:hypothetical protein
MNVLEWVVLAIAAPTVVAYLCRLDMLTYSGHRPAVVLMHICLACATVLAGYHATQGQADALDLFSAAGAALWIVVSYASWIGRVPPHFDSGPVPLDDGPPTNIAQQ